jgi:hypothetical protein
MSAKRTAKATASKVVNFMLAVLSTSDKTGIPAHAERFRAWRVTLDRSRWFVI